MHSKRLHGECECGVILFVQLMLDIIGERFAELLRVIRCWVAFNCFFERLHENVQLMHALQIGVQMLNKPLAEMIGNYS